MPASGAPKFYRTSQGFDCYVDRVRIGTVIKCPVFDALWLRRPSGYYEPLANMSAMSSALADAVHEELGEDK